MRIGPLRCQILVFRIRLAAGVERVLLWQFFYLLELLACFSLVAHNHFLELGFVGLLGVGVLGPGFLTIRI